MEFSVKIWPSLVFFVTGTCRYYRIRDIGEGRVHYSRHFLIKCAISLTMATAYLLYILIVLAMPEGVPNSGWINICDEDYYTLFYAIQSLAWLGSWALMRFEYKRRLSEEWYANQLFWVLNLIFEIISIAVLWNAYI